MMYGCMRWFTFAYWMHANLNTYLFYDLVLLIECSCQYESYKIFLKCISCVAQIGYVLAQVAGHVCRLHLRMAYVLPECWFISVPANFRRSICPIFAKVMPDFSVNFGMTCARICRKYRVPRVCVLNILVVAFDRFSINVSTMNIGNVWQLKGFRYLQILRRRGRPVRRNLPRWW